MDRRGFSDEQIEFADLAANGSFLSKKQSAFE